MTLFSGDHHLGYIHKTFFPQFAITGSIFLSFKIICEVFIFVSSCSANLFKNKVLANKKVFYSMSDFLIKICLV